MTIYQRERKKKHTPICFLLCAGFLILFLKKKTSFNYTFKLAKRQEIPKRKMKFQQRNEKKCRIGFTMRTSELQVSIENVSKIRKRYWVGIVQFCLQIEKFYVIHLGISYCHFRPSCFYNVRFAYFFFIFTDGTMEHRNWSLVLLKK